MYTPHTCIYVGIVPPIPLIKARTGPKGPKKGKEGGRGRGDICLIEKESEERKKKKVAFSFQARAISCGIMHICTCTCIVQPTFGIPKQGISSITHACLHVCITYIQSTHIPKVNIWG